MFSSQLAPMTSCACCFRPPVVPRAAINCSRLQSSGAGLGAFAPWGREMRHSCSKRRRVRTSILDSYESSSDFVKRMEQAWLISQQPKPVSCNSCNSKGHVECKWCGGTGFFILGDNMLCQVPSRNTSCVICAGKGSTCCEDCKGTGYRARWLGEAPSSK